MSEYDKIEKDYKDSDSAIAKKANEEVQKIREKAARIRKEAEKIGEDVESSIRKDEEKTGSNKKG
jgi:hypothetical protein